MFVFIIIIIRVRVAYSFPWTNYTRTDSILFINKQPQTISYFWMFKLNPSRIVKLFCRAKLLRLTWISQNIYKHVYSFPNLFNRIQRTFGSLHLKDLNSLEIFLMLKSLKFNLLALKQQQKLPATELHRGKNPQLFTINFALCLIVHS